LQLVAFPVDSQFSVRREWWGELVGDDPSETANTRMERTQQGQFQDNLLVVTVDPVRITWSIIQKPGEAAPSRPLANIGSFLETRDRFVELMSRWLNNYCPPVKRLGFAGSLLQKTENHDSGYTTLGRYLPEVRIRLDSSDFMYRINRKVPSEALPGIQLNRLNSWVFIKGVLFVQAVTAGAPEQAGHQVGPEEYACVLEFDINTPAERTEPLPQDRLQAIFQECARHATNFAAHGDEP
jgi:hypothetical protein